MKKLSTEQIKDYWKEQAVTYKQSAEISWSDVSVIEMEIREITNYLSDGNRVLDVGCANGYSTVQYASHRKIDILGLDYIPEMVAEARKRVEGVQNKLAGRVAFAVGDMTALELSDNNFDVVISTRVVINLGTWDIQMKGISECIRVLKKDGKLLLSEATLQGWNKLNDFRKEWGLMELPVPPFNNYLDEKRLISEVSPFLELLHISNFASTYYVGTRVLKPLLNQAVGNVVNVSDPLMEWNRFWSLLPSAGDYGTQKLFVFRKK